MVLTTTNLRTGFQVADAVQRTVEGATCRAMAQRATTGGTFAKKLGRRWCELMDKYPGTYSSTHVMYNRALD